MRRGDQDENPAEDAGAPADGASFSGITLAHNAREPADVDRMLTVAETAGARITKPAQDAVWGGRTGDFADPDRYLWDVAGNPHFPILADGALRLPQEKLVTALPRGMPASRGWRCDP